MASKDELLKAVQAATVEKDGRATLRCGDAFQLAEKMSSDLATVGRICNENGIKIVHCQLGCFK